MGGVLFLFVHICGASGNCADGEPMFVRMVQMVSGSEKGKRSRIGVSVSIVRYWMDDV